MRITSSPRRTIAAATLLLTAVGSSVAASADDQRVITGSCAKTYNVSSPSTIRCSFTLSAASHTFGGGGWNRPTEDGSNVAAWTFTMNVDGQPQPLNSCAGAAYSGCGTVTWTSDAIPKGAVITCVVRAVGKGNFSCDAQKD